MVACDDGAMTAHCVRLLSEPRFRAEVTVRGLEVVRQRISWTVFRDQVCGTISSLV
jgi:hypothetical protein